MRYKYLFPVATVAALALTVPTVAAAKPSIGVDNDPQCAGFSFVASQPGEAFPGGKYTVTAQEYDSETITPVGEEAVFTGTVAWGETISVTIPEAHDYLLWTYRVDSNADGEALTTYGERQLDCRPVEQPEPETEPEPEPEEPDDETPNVPEVEEPKTPEVETPETPEVPEVATPEAPGSEPTTAPVVTEKTTARETTSGTTSGSPVVEAATPVKATPRTVG